MSEVYVLVHAKKTASQTIMAYIMLALAVACLALCFMQFVIALPLVVVFGLLWYKMQFRSYKEYECSYFDGDIRFARIMNKSKRKKLKGYDINQVIQIAPEGDRSVYKYENDNSVKIKDFTSGDPDIQCYDMIVKDEEGTVLFKLELDDKYLNAVCFKHASKVIRK